MMTTKSNKQINCPHRIVAKKSIKILCIVHISTTATKLTSRAYTTAPSLGV